jgi:hypothetical protein
MAKHVECFFDKPHPQATKTRCIHPLSCLFDETRTSQSDAQPRPCRYCTAQTTCCHSEFPGTANPRGVGAYVIARCSGRMLTVGDEGRHEASFEGPRALSMGSPGAWETRSDHAGISGSPGGHPKDGSPLRYKSPFLERDVLTIIVPHPPSRPTNPHSSIFARITTHAPMFPNEFLGFDINDLTELNNNSYCDDNLGFDGLNWDGAGPSQPYSGVGVQGDLDDYPNSPTPSTAPTSFYPTYGVSL